MKKIIKEKGTFGVIGLGRFGSALAQGLAASGAEVILSVREREEAAQKLIGCLPDVLKNNSTVQLGRGFAAGFKIGFNDSEVFLDFSDEALADVICEFVGPKLAAVIKA